LGVKNKPPEPPPKKEGKKGRDNVSLSLQGSVECSVRRAGEKNLVPPACGERVVLLSCLGRRREKRLCFSILIISLI